MDKQLKEEVSRCLRKNVTHKPNLMKAECEALKSLKKNDGLVIMKSDKGNSTVLMDKADYEKKMLKLLQTDDYRILKKDPTTSFKKKIKDNLMAIERAGRLPTPLRKCLLLLNNRSLHKFMGFPRSINLTFL